MTVKNVNIPRCLFKKSYNRTFKTWSLSLRGLTKEQLNFILYLFENLSSDGVIESSVNGFTRPSLSLTSVVPLCRGVGNTLVVPNQLINSVVSPFGCSDFDCRDQFVDYTGKFISNTSDYG